jgi:O-acetylserine/cysteine efflux transporter
MKPIHIALAIGLTVVWGLNYVAIRIGLDHFPPLFFAALRFAIAGLPALILPRPNIPVWRLFAISLTLYVGQIGLLFPGMQAGYPPGLASLTVQVQAFFSVMLAAATLHELPKLRQVLGMIVAFGGLALIAATVGSNGVTVVGLALILGSALSWAAGNVVLRGTAKVDMFGLNSWIALLAAPPLLVLSFAFETPALDLASLTLWTWSGVNALIYVAVPTTILGFWVWAELLKRYPTALVAPFTLLVPVTGMVASWILLGESFGSVRLAGMALILIGLAVNSLPFGRWWVARS